MFLPIDCLLTAFFAAVGMPPEASCHPVQMSFHGYLNYDFPMQLDDTICYCFHVSKRKIVNYLRVHEPLRASQLSQCGGAGTGCGWCVAYLKQSFAEYKQLGNVTNDTVNPEDYARERAAYIRAGKGTPARGAVPLPPDEAGR